MMNIRQLTSNCDRAAARYALERATPVELPPAVEKSPVSEPLPWHPDHEDHGVMIAAFALDPRMPIPRTAFAQ
jgi:hypothetical protein